MDNLSSYVRANRKSWDAENEKKILNKVYLANQILKELEYQELSLSDFQKLILVIRNFPKIINILSNISKGVYMLKKDQKTTFWGVATTVCFGISWAVSTFFPEQVKLIETIAQGLGIISVGLMGKSAKDAEPE